MDKCHDPTKGKIQDLKGFERIGKGLRRTYNVKCFVTEKTQTQS